MECEKLFCKTNIKRKVLKLNKTKIYFKTLTTLNNYVVYVKIVLLTIVNTNLALT